MKTFSDTLEMVLLPKNMALRMMISMSLNFIWGSMNDMSFLTLLSLISIAVPGIAQVFMKIILKFLYLDVLMTEDWLLHWLISENKMYYIKDGDEGESRILTDEELDDNLNSDDSKEVGEKDHGLNEYFEESDIGSMQMIVNIGSTLIYLAFIGSSFTVYLLLWIITYWIT